MIKKAINNIFSRFGYKIVPKTQALPKNWFTMERALNRASNLFPEINTIIDVGASDGRWSRDCLRFYPEASYLLIEAQEAHKDGLEQFKKDVAKGDFEIAVAGATNGSVFFDDSELFGGQAYKKQDGKNLKELPQIALDTAVEKHGLIGPFILKLDTHGFEVPILEGAQEVLKSTSVLIVETYNFKLTKNSLRYWEMCQYLDQLGFSPIENVDLMLRKKDHVFWQMDTFFIKNNHKLFNYNKYE